MSMTYLDQLACKQGRQDEQPNLDLARRLVATGDETGIREIAENLRHDDPAISSDCIKVIYEIGYLRPDLIADYVQDFLSLLHSRNNRLVWGAMIALSTVANLKPHEIYQDLDTLYAVIAGGSVITVDNGIKVLAILASQDPAYHRQIFPFLIDHLKNCRPKEVSQHAESIAVAVDPNNLPAFQAALASREPDLTPTQQSRIRKTIKKLQQNHTEPYSN